MYELPWDSVGLHQDIYNDKDKNSFKNIHTTTKTIMAHRNKIAGITPE